MTKYIFIYDELLKKSQQEVLSLGLNFICFGTVKARLYFLNDDKKKRLYIVPNTGKSTKVTFGALYEIPDYEEAEYKLYAFYNSMIPFVGSPVQEDLFIPYQINVTPIQFTSLRDIETGNYAKGKEVTALTFIGNLHNRTIIHNNKYSYYRVNSVNVQGFVECIKDNFKTTKETEVKKHGLE